MHWTNPVSGEFHSKYSELFNMATNTEVLLSDVPQDEVHSLSQGNDYDFYYIGYDEELKYFVIFWDYTRCFGYNIGYTETVPTKEDVKARVFQLRKWAEEELIQKQKEEEEEEDNKEENED